jgi:hypothetical protein
MAKIDGRVNCNKLKLRGVKLRVFFFKLRVFSKRIIIQGSFVKFSLLFFCFQFTWYDPKGRVNLNQDFELKFLFFFLAHKTSINNLHNLFDLMPVSFSFIFFTICLLNF